MKRAIATLCALCLLLAIPFAASAKAPDFCSAEEWEILKRTNEERIAAGKQPLTTFPSITAAARLRAEECITLFEHTRPNGTTCFTALDEAGIIYQYAGENLAAGHRDPTEAVQGWMDSTKHRENLLNPDHKHLGAGFVRATSSVYGRFWTQFFIYGCTTTALSNGAELPLFDQTGALLNDPALKVTCNIHGDCYLPLKNANPTFLGNNTYKVTYDGVTATLPCTTGTGYPDVFSDLWYWEGIQFASEHGLMKGMPDGTFAPDKAMTRAEFVTILYRMEQQPTVHGDDGFTDVYASDWFYNEVRWAVSTGMVNGMGDGTFAPNKPVTRAEMATILLRYHKATTGEGTVLAPISRFPDYRSVPAWAEEGVRTAVSWNVLSGSYDHATGQTLLLPQGNTTRAQIATVLMRYLTK